MDDTKKNTGSNKKISYIQLIIIAIILLLFTVTTWAPESLDLSEFEAKDFLPILSLLILLTLLAERTLEVLMTTIRGPMGSEKDQKIEFKRKKISIQKSKDQPDPNINIEKLEEELKVLIMEREKDRMITRRYSLWLGLLIGIVISSVGFRLLHEIVANPPTEGTDQATIFNIVDIILTGCVIAGGSDGVHKISELYNSFMLNKTKSNREQAQAKI